MIIIFITSAVLFSSIGVIILAPVPKKLEVNVKPEDLSDLWVNVYGEIIGLVEQ